MDQIKLDKYIIDASVYIGIYDKEEHNHKQCLEFCEQHKNSVIYFPAHCFFEQQAALSKRKRAGTFTASGVITTNIQFYPIDKSLISRCQENKLFHLFDRLPGGDLIYACIAKIEGLTLVTCDANHFKKYKNEINIKIL